MRRASLIVLGLVVLIFFLSASSSVAIDITLPSNIYEHTIGENHLTFYASNLAGGLYLVKTKDPEKQANYRK